MSIDKDFLTDRPSSPAIPTEPPPDYEEAAPAAPVPAELPAEPEEKSGAPTNAQRAQVPLRVEQANKAIREQYVILHTPDQKPDVDVFLKTTNGRIECGIWVEGSWGRKIRIEAQSTNAKVELAVNTLVAGQAIDVTATSTNSSVTLAIPPTFHGTIVLDTTNSSRNISATLQTQSVRIPLEKSDGKSAVRYQIGGPRGDDRASIKSTNASVNARFTTDEVAQAGPKSCTLM